MSQFSTNVQILHWFIIFVFPPFSGFHIPYFASPLRFMVLLLISSSSRFNSNGPISFLSQFSFDRQVDQFFLNLRSCQFLHNVPFICLSSVHLIALSAFIPFRIFVVMLSCFHFSWKFFSNNFFQIFSSIITVYVQSHIHSYMWHDSFIYVTWLIHMCDMTHSFVRYDSFICDVTNSYMRLDSLTTNSVWAIFDQIYDMNHSYVQHDSFICAPWLIHYLFCKSHPRFARRADFARKFCSESHVSTANNKKKMCHVLLENYSPMKCLALFILIGVFSHLYRSLIWYSELLVSTEGKEKNMCSMDHGQSWAVYAAFLFLK